MIIFPSIVTLIFFYKFLKVHKKKEVLKNKQITSFTKKSLNQWMNLTKKERYKLSKKDSVTYLNKRKVLLDQIRKEYKIISKGNKKNMDT